VNSVLVDHRESSIVTASGILPSQGLPATAVVNLRSGVVSSNNPRLQPGVIQHHLPWGFSPLKLETVNGKRQTENFKL
jgi:hypothetical protein